jgi:hypothetical protein
MNNLTISIRLVQAIIIYYNTISGKPPSKKKKREIQAMVTTQGMKSNRGCFVIANLKRNENGNNIRLGKVKAKKCAFLR